MVGIEEVAALAGVSTATVSRALRGKDHVSAKAQKKVEDAASELGYVASSSAATLATGRTQNIGVVLPYIDRWFFSVILEAIETELIDHGYDLTLYNLSGGEKQRKRIFDELLLRKRVDGVLAVAVNPTEAELANLNRMHKPIVGIGGAIEGARSITMNDISAGKLATEHLISLGHTRIGIIGGPHNADDQFGQPGLRYYGYAQAMKESGLKINKKWVAECDFTIPGAYVEAKQLFDDLRNAPSALFCASDEMAFGAIMAAKDLGLDVPQDLSVVGIDDHNLSEFFGLSTIAQNPADQGRAAVKTLLEILALPHTEQQVNVEEINEWPLKLIVRASTAKFAKR
jgi:DNA-binding LacI/PurR family transcriptional regulator